MPEKGLYHFIETWKREFKFTNNVSTHIGLKGVSSKVKESQFCQVLFGIHESIRVMVLLEVFNRESNILDTSVRIYLKGRY